MGAIRKPSEPFWRSEVDPREQWKPTRQTEEVAPGRDFLHAHANVSILRTQAGLVLIDSSNHQACAKTFAAVRSLDPAPLCGISHAPAGPRA